VELKDRADVDYALEKFEALWAEAIDLSEEYIDVINRRTWLNDRIRPYELYLKFLYEYFKEEINADDDFDPYLPQGFMDLAYQRQAVVSARRILNTYNGVFLADVALEERLHRVPVDLRERRRHDDHRQEERQTDHDLVAGRGIGPDGLAKESQHDDDPGEAGKQDQEGRGQRNHGHQKDDLQGRVHALGPGQPVDADGQGRGDGSGRRGAVGFLRCGHSGEQR